MVAARDPNGAHAPGDEGREQGSVPDMVQSMEMAKQLKDRQQRDVH